MTTTEDTRTAVRGPLSALTRAPERIAFVDPDGETSAGAALDLAFAMGRALRALGLGPGRILATMAPASTRGLLLTHAAHLVGAGVAHVPDALAPDVRERLLAEIGPAALAVDPAHCADLAEELEAAERRGTRVLTLGPAKTGEDLLALADDQPGDPFAPLARLGDPRWIGLTGGSTRTPRPVLRRFRAADVHATVPAPPQGGGAATFLCLERVDARARAMADAAVAKGGTVVSLPRAEPGEVLAAVQRWRVTHVLLMPSAVAELVTHPALARTDVSSLRQVIPSGGPMPPALLRAAVDLLGPVLHPCYGQSETGSISMLRPDDYRDGDRAAMRSVGRPLPGVQVAVRDHTGADLPPGRAGEVWVRTAAAMDGYLHRPEPTARVLRDGWVDTGDIGALDSAGRLTLLGRRSEALRVGGRTVFPRQVDDVLAEHPDVMEAATFDVPGPGGAVLHTAATLADGADTTGEALRAWLEDRLHPPYVPERVIVVPRIPVTHAGTHDRGALRRAHRATG